MAMFDYAFDYKNLNLRKHPELYGTDRGEQGVLLVEPYKSEILPYWKFKTPELAKTSVKKIYTLFLQYKAENDFVGMTWPGSFCKWAILAVVDMPITGQERNTMVLYQEKRKVLMVPMAVNNCLLKPTKKGSFGPNILQGLAKRRQTSFIKRF